MSLPTEQHPAERLLGRTLEGGWRVMERLSRAPGATGGCFSVGYLVEKTTGEQAFLKALDFSRALQSADPASALQVLTEAFLFERNILNLCSERRLDRVAKSIAHGTTHVPEAGIIGAVSYLIFEKARGNVRDQIDLSQRFDLALRLRALHHIAVGLGQLHRQGIAHQDLKPSNVLLFDGNESRVADLGRAAAQGQTPPHAGFVIPGDPSYAPPELIYGHVSTDWYVRRHGTDLYHLGSMIVFLFASSAMTPELLRDIPPSHQWPAWQGTYNEALPVLRMAFGQALGRIKANMDSDLPKDFIAILIDMLIQLCNPDINERGNPKLRGNPAGQYSIETYISRFNLLASNAEFHLRRKASEA